MANYGTVPAGSTGYVAQINSILAMMGNDVSALQGIAYGSQLNIAAPAYITGMGVSGVGSTATVSVRAGACDINGNIYTLPSDTVISGANVAYAGASMTWRAVAVMPAAGGVLSAANFSTYYTTLEGTLDGTKRIAWNGHHWVISDLATPNRVIGLYASANGVVFGHHLSGGWMTTYINEVTTNWRIVNTSTPPTTNTVSVTGLPSWPTRMWGLYRVEAANPGAGVMFLGYHWYNMLTMFAIGATSVRISGLSIGASDSGSGFIQVTNGGTTGTPNLLDIRLLAMAMPPAMGV